MQPQSPTFTNLFAGLRRLHPTERKTRLVNWALLVLGLLRARSAALPAIAAHLPLPTQAGSREKRLRRWFDNLAVEVVSFFAPVGRGVLQTLHAAGAPLRLLMDRVEVENRFNLLVVCVAYRHRAFPLLWKELGHAGCSTLAEQTALLQQVQRWVPPGAEVIVVADREFRSVRLAEWLQKRHWHFVLRLKCDTHIEVRPGEWQRLDALGLSRGQRCWVPGVRVALAHPFGPVNVALVWARGSDEPWYLMTDLPTLPQAVTTYCVRMWCEELWRDFKSQGFDLEATGVMQGARLERLLLGVALAVVWALWTGAEVVRHHWRRVVDSGRQRRLSFFLIGVRWLEHCWALNQALTFLLPPEPLEVT